MLLAGGREPTHTGVVGVDHADQSVHALLPRDKDLILQAGLRTPVVPGYGSVPLADHYEEVAFDKGQRLGQHPAKLPGITYVVGRVEGKVLAGVVHVAGPVGVDKLLVIILPPMAR